VVATLGNAIAPIALAFAVLDLTGSLAQLGLVVGARTAANVVFVLYGGAVADRLPRGLVLVGSSVAAGLSQAIVAALVLTSTATIAWLVVLSAVNGTAAAFALPASSAVVPQTVPVDLRQQANSVQRAGVNGANILGASLGGMLVGAFGPGVGLAVDACTFLLSASAFSLLRVDSPRSGLSVPLPRQLRDGWSEFVARPWVWQVVLAFMVINACFAAYVDVLGPFVADRTFGRGGWGFVLGAQGLGLLVGAVVAMRMRARRLLLLGCASMGVIVLVPLGLVVWPSTVPLVIAAFIAGIGLDLFGVAWETSLQQHIPTDRLARVVSYDILGSYVAIPVAVIVVPGIATVLGLRATLVSLVAMVALCVLGMVASRSIRSVRQP
jgi:MFS family permease